MLIRNTTPADPQQYLADTFLNPPSVARSSYDNFAMSFASPFMSLELLNNQFADSPQGQMVRGMKEGLSLINQNAGIGQSAANFTSSMLGFALNPINLLAGEAGGALLSGTLDVLPGALSAAGATATGDAATTLMSKPLTDFATTDVAKAYLGGKTVGSVADQTLTALGAGAGSAIPGSISDNYNFDTKHINWGGVAKDAGTMGAFALGISSIPFAYGVLKGKVNTGLDLPNAAIDQAKMDAALKDGRITPEEHAWLADYHTLQKNPDDVTGMADVQARASKILNDNNIYANSVSNEVPFNILKPEDMDSLKSAASDQLTSGLPDNFKDDLTNFVAQNSLDNLRDNPKILDGVRGYVDHINDKLAAKPEKLAESDAILDTHLTRKVNENLPFSQKEIMRMMKKSNFDTSHMEHFPLTVPDNIQKIIKLDNRIKQLKEKIRNTPNKQVSRRIEEIESQKPAILTPKEELRSLREKLTNGKAPERLSSSPDYHRLIELSQVWKNAKGLLDRVHEEDQYRKQEAFKNLCSEILKLNDSNTQRLADPEKVSEYLNQRLQEKINRTEETEDVKEQIDTLRKTQPEETDTQEQKARVDTVKAGGLNKEFNAASEKLKEFKSAGKILSDFMSCIIGGLGG